MRIMVCAVGPQTGGPRLITLNLDPQEAFGQSMEALAVITEGLIM